MDEANELELLAQENFEQYLETGALQDLELSIQRYKQVLDLRPDAYPERARPCQNLALCCNKRYDQLGTLEDLETAIKLHHQAIDLTPSDDLSHRADRLINLGINYGDRYRRLGDINDLEAAIQYHHQGIELTPESRPDRAASINDLGNYYISRYERLGALSDLETGLQCHQQVVDLTPSNHSNLASRLNNLGADYADRYGQLGALSDLDAAILYHCRALEITSPENLLEQAAQFANLGISYNQRFGRLGALYDLDNAIKCHEQAVKATPTDHPYQAGRLYNVAVAYRDRYLRNKVPDDLERSIKLGQEALDLTPEDHPHRADRLQILGTGYNDLYLRTKDMADLDLSIQHTRKALELTPSDHPRRANLFESLALRYGDRFMKTRTLEDVELFVQHCQTALDLTPKGHRQRADRLRFLGIAYIRRCAQTETLDGLEVCISQFEEALSMETSSPLTRLRVGRGLFDVYTIIEDWESAYKTASLTVTLIPLLTPNSMERSDLQHQVNEIVGLASDAAAIALKVKRPIYEVIALLEVGRGIITNSLGNIRTDITDLKDKSPVLAQDFSKLRDLLEASKESRIVSRESRTETQRYDASKQMQDLIGRIRALPSFDRFLLAPREEEMISATVHGPIVIVNVSKFGSHALLIQQTGLQALELPFLEINDIQTKAEELTSPNIEMLEWLWNTVAEPILTSLNLIQLPEHTWPRIWWVLTGLLARFPIHAAGRYSEGDQGTLATVMDRVVSSYSSSVRAIIDARRNRPLPVNSLSEKPAEGSMVLIGMETTPGQSPLQFAQKEIEVLTRLGQSMQLRVEKPHPLLDETLLALRRCRIFHFAGHGYTDASDPSNSALLLHDGRLTVENMFDINLYQQRPFLAYLSACGTGRIKEDKLLDEGLHLIGACQLAGFQHVIGTLWEVNDESCVEIAGDTYRWLQAHNLESGSVGEGLHHACRAYRRRWVEMTNLRQSVRSNMESPGRVNDESIQTELHTTQAGVRDPRDIDSIDDLPLHWVPYVHYGI